MSKQLREGLAVLCLAVIVALVGVALDGARLAYVLALALAIGGLIAVTVELVRSTRSD